MILPIFVFSRSRNSMVPLSKLYHHWLTSKIQFEPEILELWGYPSVSLVEFYNITYIYVFEADEFNGHTFTFISLSRDFENPVRTGSTGTSRLPIFLELDFWGQPVVVEFWKCHYWIPRPWKHKYRWYHKIPPGKKMGNLEVPVFPVKPGFSRSTGSRRILNVSPLNSSTSKT